VGLPLRNEYVQHGDFQLESGHQRGEELLRLSTPPTAIFSCNNQMTLGLMRALYEHRVPCPERISVLGFDDFDWAANFSPRLTTAAQPTIEMGRQAMQILLRLMKSFKEKGPDGVGQEKVIALKAELRVRDSTAPLMARQSFERFRALLHRDLRLAERLLAGHIENSKRDVLRLFSGSTKLLSNTPSP